MQLPSSLLWLLLLLLSIILKKKSGRVNITAISSDSYFKACHSYYFIFPIIRSNGEIQIFFKRNFVLHVQWVQFLPFSSGKCFKANSLLSRLPCILSLYIIHSSLYNPLSWTSFLLSTKIFFSLKRKMILCMLRRIFAPVYAFVQYNYQGPLIVDYKLTIKDYIFY